MTPQIQSYAMVYIQAQIMYRTLGLALLILQFNQQCIAYVFKVLR